MENENLNRTIHRLVFDKQILDFLKTKDNHKLSRYDALMWLIEHILKGYSFSHEGESCFLQQYNVTISDLADIWHWSRPTVHKFIKELISMNLVQRQRFGYIFAFSLTASAQSKIS